MIRRQPRSTLSSSSAASVCIRDRVCGGKVFAANSTDMTPAFGYADESVVTPLIYDDGYIDFLLDYCKVNRIDAIVSLFDIDLPVLAQNKHKFAEIGVNVIVSDTQIINICNDKWNTYRFLKDNNFNCPHTYISLKDALCDLDNGTISYPVIVKPRWGMGSIGVFSAENPCELKIFYNKTKREIENTYLKFEASCDIDHCVIIQEKLKGQEYGLDIINDLNGIYQNTVVKKKFAMRSGETDCAETVDCSILKNTGEKLSMIMKHTANLDCDVFMDGDLPYILEMNARFGGGYPFSHAAGVNLPLAIIRWLNHECVDASVLTAKTGITAHKDIAIKIL